MGEVQARGGVGRGAGAGWGGTGELELIWCDAPSPVLMVTELRELVFQLERPS